MKPICVDFGGGLELWATARMDFPEPGRAERYHGVTEFRQRDAIGNITIHDVAVNSTWSSLEPIHQENIAALENMAARITAAVNAAKESEAGK